VLQKQIELKMAIRIIISCFLGAFLFFSLSISNSSARIEENEEVSDPAQAEQLRRLNEMSNEDSSAETESESEEHEAAYGFDVSFIDKGGVRDVESLGTKIMRFLNLTIAALSMLGVMIGGVVLITAAGNDSQVQYGKEILKFSLIGLVVTLSAYLIVTLVQTILYSFDA
jgi:hypothetical protein